jgi:hypothetical protein
MVSLFHRKGHKLKIILLKEWTLTERCNQSDPSLNPSTTNYEQSNSKNTNSLNMYSNYANMNGVKIINQVV